MSISSDFLFMMLQIILHELGQWWSKLSW